MAEFWLKNETDSIELLLPVALAEYEFEHGNNIETISTTNFGDVNISAHRKLTNMKLRGFFPKNDYDFSRKLFEPMEYVKRIQNWIDSKTVIRLVISENGITKVNKTFYIESISHSETSETNGDINYVISLREYRKIEATKIITLKAMVGNSARSDTKTTPKANTYTVVSGDSLTRIARKMYGDGSKWTVILEANKTIIKNKDVIYAGQVLTIPSLAKPSKADRVIVTGPTSIMTSQFVETTIK